MIKLSIITTVTIIFLLITINLFSQPCLPNGITFNTQVQIDNFQTNYLNCTEIEGDVTINGDDISDLFGLSLVTSIGGDLQIGGWLLSGGNPSLTSLTGLDNVTSIGGTLDIHKNNALTSLTGLDNLTSIGGHIDIGFNGALTNLSGLDNLDSIGGGVEITANDALTNLMSLNNLTSITGDLNIQENDSLITLTGLDNVTTIGGGVEIRANGALTNLIGLENLTSIGGDLWIWENDSLINLTGLENLESINGDIVIGGYWGNYYQITYAGNPLLKSIEALNNLTSSKSISILCNPSLTNLTGLNNISSIKGSLLIAGNDSLTNLEGLDNVHTITGSLEIGFIKINIFEQCLGNSNLINLTGLGNLDSIGESLIIIDNESLTSLNVLDNITSLSGDLKIIENDILLNLTGLDNLTALGGDLRVKSNNALTNLTGLENLVSIGGYLGIISSDNLTSLTGLENLTSIEGDLKIGDILYWGGVTGNSSLTSLSELVNVTFVGGDLYIMGNAALTSLSGLDNIDATSIDSLFIYDNPSLITCEVQSICDYLASPNGTVVILNNANGCNNPPEVANACGITLPCLPFGNYYFFTQADIDNFQTNYPNCTLIKGKVDISGNDITNLNGLNVLNSIWGTLNIYGNEVLVSVTGLENLTSIAGGLSIGDDYYGGNPVLTSLTGLDNLDPYSISDLNIYNNNSLSTCEVQSVCDYLAAPNGNINIDDNAPGCNSHEEVEEICIYSCLPEGIEFYSQIEIDSFQYNFPDCIKIHGDVTISGDDIFNLSGLDILKYIGGNLEITGNDALYSLSGLEGLSMISGDLIILDNNMLTTLSGLNNIISIGDKLWITSNDALNSLSGLDELSVIGSDLSISDNNILTNLSGLNNISSIGGILYIENNSSITNIWGLQNIDPGSIVNLHIFDNASLSECDVQSVCEYIASPGATIQIYNNAPGCNNLEELEEACENHCLYEGITFNTQEEIDGFQSNFPLCNDIDGDVEINGDDITNLVGLNVVTSIGGALTLGSFSPGGGNPYLTNISGLSNLVFIGEGLFIAMNHELNSLSGLDSLSSIGGRFEIMANASLTDIAGLNNINTGSINNLMLNLNYSLSDCAVESICDYLASPNAVVLINNNAPGCNSQEEVEDACDTLSVIEIIFNNTFTISPNPCSGSANLRYTIAEKGIVIIDLFEISGVRIKRLLNEAKMPGTHILEIDISDMPKGIYFCALKTNEGIQTRKIIKL